MRPDTPRIRELLAALDDARTDLAAAVTPEQAANAREDVRQLHHNLWLAGYEPEELS